MTRLQLINKLAVLALMPTILFGVDLSAYRGFQFGMSLSAAVKHSGVDVSEVMTLHERPARIEELDWSPGRFSRAEPSDPVQQVRFSFYNGQLFRTVVDYDDQKTEGMTVPDMIESLSVGFGTPIRLPIDTVLPSSSFSEGVKVVARWEDIDYTFNLVQSPYGLRFGLIGFSKRLDGLATAAVASGIRLDQQEAPARQKTKEQDAQGKLDKARITNRLHFRP